MSAARVALPDALTGPGVLAIVRGARDAAWLREAGAALLEGGVAAVEVAGTGPDAAEGIAALSTVPGLTVGAGTVLSREQTDRVVAAGASFLVMPHVDADLVAWAAGAGLATLPGALTPTEALTAWGAGAAAVKLFPAAPLGPEYLAALREPLGHLQFVPTGGVTDENAEAFVAAGAVAVAAASWLVPAPPAELSPSRLRARAASLVDAVARGRAHRVPTHLKEPVA